MASYSSFGAFTPPVLYGDDEESKRNAQTQQAPTAPAPQVAPPQAPPPMPDGTPRVQPPQFTPTNPAPRPVGPAGGPQPQPAPPQPGPTFAQLQQQGQARPAPPQPQGVPLQSPTMPAGMLPTGDMDRWRQQVAQIAAVPTRFDDLAFMQMRNASQADLDAQFANERQRLDETLAARGLYDSSIAGNQYRDLGGQQARAMANLDAQLLKEMAQTQMQDRLASAGLSGQLASFGENSRQFDVQQALAERLGLGNLDLNKQQLDQQESQFGRSLEQNDLARQLQERLALTEMSGTYMGADGKQYNTIERDRLDVEREVGGNDFLIRLAGMLGVDLSDIIGKKDGENTPPTQTGTPTGPVGNVPTTTASAPRPEWEGIFSEDDFRRRYPNATAAEFRAFANWLSNQQTGNEPDPLAQLSALFGGN